MIHQPALHSSEAKTSSYKSGRIHDSQKCLPAVSQFFQVQIQLFYLIIIHQIEPAWQPHGFPVLEVDKFSVYLKHSVLRWLRCSNHWATLAITNEGSWTLSLRITENSQANWSMLLPTGATLQGYTETLVRSCLHSLSNASTGEDLWYIKHYINIFNERV